MFTASLELTLLLIVFPLLFFFFFSCVLLVVLQAPTSRDQRERKCGTYLYIHILMLLLIGYKEYMYKDTADCRVFNSLEVFAYCT